MTIRWVPFLVVVALNLLLDVYTWRVLRASRAKAVCHVVLSVLLFAAVLTVWLTPIGECGDGRFRLTMWLLYGYFAAYVPRYLALPFWLFGRQRRSLSSGKGRFIRRCATTIGILTFAIMLWSALVTPRTLTVTEETVEYADLPDAFDGYRIVQFSDTHLGSYCNGDTAFVARYVQEINDLRPDMICFTGDLVNRFTREAMPFAPILRRLRAKDGVMSIHGNHDYDDYTTLDTLHRVADHRALTYMETALGWTVLENEHRVVVRGADSIVVIGLGNNGGPVHPDYSDYAKAYPDYKDGNFKILLQHGSKFWRKMVTAGSDNVHLTLSGHTHAMQMMVSAFGYRWSPAALMYKEWGGLYRDADRDRYLNVNIGLGQVGIPSRIGATPEITVITLNKKR